jgi:hypothetical protein
MIRENDRKKKPKAWRAHICKVVLYYIINRSYVRVHGSSTKTFDGTESDERAKNGWASSGHHIWSTADIRDERTISGLHTQALPVHSCTPLIHRSS